MAWLCKTGAVVILTLLVVLHSQCCSADRYLANDSYTYRLMFANGTVCMTVSMNAEINIYYRTANVTPNGTVDTLKLKKIDLPTKNETNSTGSCTEDTRKLVLSWLPEDSGSRFEAAFNFSVLKKEWYLAQVEINVDLDDLTLEAPEAVGLQSYETTVGQRLFNRTFGNNQYFHCKACKRLWLRGNNDSNSGPDDGPCYTQLVEDSNSTSCSHLFLHNTVLYPGDLDNNTAVKKKLCLEDFIDLQEIIIPAAVGGVLGILMLVIFIAYLMAFIRRKQREGQYETINDTY